MVNVLVVNADYLIPWVLFKEKLNMSGYNPNIIALKDYFSENTSSLVSFKLIRLIYRFGTDKSYPTETMYDSYQANSIMFH